MRNILFLILSLFLFEGNASAQQLPKVEMKTKWGVITMEIDTLKAPVTGKNFLMHVKNGTYKDAVFYRVVRLDNQPNNDVKIEVIQGGLFDDKQIDQISPISHETTEVTGIKHRDGTLSMARNAPGSASTEFFICVGDQTELDYGGTRNPDGQGFAAFGNVVSGMDVVRKIQQEKDTTQYLVDPVKIELTLVK
ncbi:peptidylprolyl isomerase [Maribellus sp. YY47]|uniref:peptidylprolyl isomerase n=1 Tax=Maribellus sp. YY47 TaxID=2929486 RepID=UPI00200155E5|nr:peptidylprolyl isomerase [Maribellus sp. YY47]MCK3683251.1 peptidylprolyl isomerase [Maribellus sp. YY47]